MKIAESELGETRYLIVVPQPFRTRILVAAHDRMGHQSLMKVLPWIGRNFTWPNLYTDAKLYIQQCVSCQRNGKAKPTKAPMVQMPVLSVPFEVVAIELVGPFPRSRRGYKYLLTMVCLASRYPEAEILRTISGGSRIYKWEGGGGGHKIMDLLSIKPQTGRWSKTELLQKDLFFFFGLHGIFPILQAFPVQIITKHTFSSISWPQISLFHLFLNSSHTSNPKEGGGGTLSMPIHFPIGTRPHLAQKGGACA